MVKVHESRNGISHEFTVQSDKMASAWPTNTRRVCQHAKGKREIRCTILRNLKRFLVTSWC